MAEENTTASTSTPTEQTDPTPGAEASTGSNTETNPNPTPEGDEDGSEGTILTTPPADDNAADAAGDGSGDDKTEDKPAENAELFGAPEGDYALEGLPEGTVVDEKALEAVAPVARELGLSNKGLSMIAGVYAEKVLPQVVEGFNDELQRSIAATHADWANQTTELVKTDEAFGGKPLKEVQQVAAKALDRLGGEGFRKFLNDTGLGNHPDMVRFAYQAGSAISEDTTFERGSSVPKPKTREEKYYGPQS